MAGQETKLVSVNTYLSAGIHIGMKQKIKAMDKYIYKVRPDKLTVFNIELIDKQLALAAKLLSQYEPQDILVVSRKKNGHKPVAKFAEIIGTKAIYGRFYPGTLTNPNYENYIEPKILVVTDTYLDRQSIEEAFNSNIPIIALCDTFNDPKNVDFVVSVNNKGRKSLALIFWVLTKEILKLRGEIKGDAEFKYPVEDFLMPEDKSDDTKDE